MKLGIFTDSHYSSAELTCGKRYNSKSLVKIREAMAYFVKNNVDVIICLGDLIDHEISHEAETENLKKISEVFKEYKTPIYAVVGNHDGFAFEREEFYSVLGEEYRPPESLETQGKMLIFTDTCYFKSGEHYKPGDTDWTDTFLPDTTRLERILSEGTGDAYLFMHHNIDPEIQQDHRVFNDAEIREILEKSGRVKTVFQGHFHGGHTSVHGGINYVTFPAMCENDKAYFIIKI